MKTPIRILLLTFGLLLAGAGSLGAAPKTLKGNGKPVSKQIAFTESFSAVSASRAVKVKLVAAPAGTIGIEADENVIDHVQIRTKGRTLHVTIDPAYTSLSNINVTVTVPTDGRLTELEASSSAHITAEPVIRGTKVSIEAASAAVIEATVEAEACDIDAASAGKIRTKVKGGSCNIEASSAAAVGAALAVEACTIELSSAAKARLTGAALRSSIETTSAAKLNAKEFAVKRCTIDASSGSKAEIYCLERLSADASSGSSILYRGDCEVNHAGTSSGGRVRKL